MILLMYVNVRSFWVVSFEKLAAVWVTFRWRLNGAAHESLDEIPSISWPCRTRSSIECFDCKIRTSKMSLGFHLDNFATDDAIKPRLRREKVCGLDSRNDDEKPKKKQCYSFEISFRCECESD